MPQACTPAPPAHGKCQLGAVGRPDDLSDDADRLFDEIKERQTVVVVQPHSQRTRQRQHLAVRTDRTAPQGALPEPVNLRDATRAAHGDRLQCLGQPRRGRGGRARGTGRRRWGHGLTGDDQHLPGPDQVDVGDIVRLGDRLERHADAGRDLGQGLARLDQVGGGAIPGRDRQYLADDDEIGVRDGVGPDDGLNGRVEPTGQTRQRIAWLHGVHRIGQGRRHPQRRQQANERKTCRPVPLLRDGLLSGDHARRNHRP